jgi:hypothetical protein
MVDLKSPWFSQSYPKQIFTFPQSPRSVLNTHLAALATSPATVTADLTLTRLPLMVTTIQHGLYPLFFPPDSSKLFPLERLARGDTLPEGGVLVLHGKSDSVVPVEHSRTLKRALEEQVSGGTWKGKVELVERAGEHGFDGELQLEGEGNEWLTEAWEPVVRSWLA